MGAVFVVVPKLPPASVLVVGPKLPCHTSPPALVPAITAASIASPSVVLVSVLDVVVCVVTINVSLAFVGAPGASDSGASTPASGVP